MGRRRSVIPTTVDAVAAQAGLAIARLRLRNRELEAENEELAKLVVRAQEDVRQLEEQLTVHRHLGMDLELAEGRIEGLEAQVEQSETARAEQGAELDALARALDLPAAAVRS